MVECGGYISDVGLKHLGDLAKLKDLYVRGQHLITAAGIVSFLKKKQNCAGNIRMQKDVFDK